MEKGKKKLFLFFEFIIFLGLGVLGIVLLNKIFNTYENRDIKDLGKWEESIHVYEEVEDISERSEVCYDNLIFLYSIFYDDIDEGKYTHLGIFNTGDVYYFKSSADFFLNEYYITADNLLIFNDSNLSNVQNVIYMGRLSNRETMLLNQYVKSFDNWEYERDYLADNLEPAFDRYTDMHRDITCLARIYYPLERYGGYRSYLTARYEMDYLGDNSYEIKIIDIHTYDNGVLDALELIESGGFYNRWMDICVENYEEVIPKESDSSVEAGFEFDNWIIIDDLGLE